MLLSQSCIYGIRAVMHLAECYQSDDDRYISTKEIGNDIDVSFYFLSKILKRLAEADVVKTFRGPKGGIKLNRPPEDIKLIEVIEAIEGKDVLGDSLLDQADCKEFELCELHKRWNQSKDFIRKNLWQANIQDLMKKSN